MSGSIPPRPGLAEALAILQSISQIYGKFDADDPTLPAFTIEFQFDRQRLRDLGANHWAEGPTPRYWVETLQRLLKDLGSIYANEARWSAQASAGASVTDCLNFLEFKMQSFRTAAANPVNSVEANLTQRTIQYLKELEERRTMGAFSNPHEARQKADSSRWQWENSQEHEEFLRQQRAQREKTSRQGDYDRAEEGIWESIFKQYADITGKGERGFFGEGYRRPGGQQRQAPPPKLNNIKFWFEVLDINAGATKKEIKAAHRKLAMKCHPDRDGGSHEKMQELNKARDDGLAGARE